MISDVLKKNGVHSGAAFVDYGYGSTSFIE